MATMRLLAAISALGLAGIAESANCYRVDGKLQSSYGWKACNPGLTASPCCSSRDYCLDNGLCLNAGVVNNYMTVQGCTDPSWGGACRKYCAGSMDSRGYVGITICDGNNNACCGDKGTCCANETFRLPFFTNLNHPLESQSSSPGSTETTPLTRPTSSGTGLPSEASNPVSPGGPAPSDASSSDQVLKVGLGVGLSLGLLLLAVIAYLMWGLRRRKAVADEMKSTPASTPAYQGPPDNVNAMVSQDTAAPKYQYQQYPSELPARLERGELSAT